MIVIKLWGGLGNQLFQYAFGYVLSKKYSEIMAFDLEFYNKQSNNIGKRDIEIQKLNVSPMKSFSRNYILKVLNNKYVGAITRRIPFRSIFIGNNMIYYKEPYHRYVPNIKCRKDMYFDGYWQSAKYFAEYRDDLISMFTPQNGISNEMRVFFSNFENKNTVAVHIRKGDFGNGTIRRVGNPISIDYYKRAIEYCRCNIDSPLFVIFSDNPVWVKENLEDASDIIYTADYIDSSSIDDLVGISMCKHGIMSASTFSWWGNWLRNCQGIVIAPKGKFYNDYFYDEDWIQM